MENNQQPVYLGVPTYDGRIDIRTARVIFTETSRLPMITKLNASSLLARNFNEIYCGALNARRSHGVKWFAMLHADIVPEAWWLDKMIAIAEENGADLLSAIVPMKDGQGLTSTGLSKIPDAGMVVSEFYGGALIRFTQEQVNHPYFPETFDRNTVIDILRDLPAHLRVTINPEYRYLLVNTGCMIMRLDQDWSRKMFFTINDRICETKDGLHYCEVEPEDWFLSRLVARNGGKVMATKAIGLKHIGEAEYHSRVVWGKSIDPKYVQS